MSATTTMTTEAPATMALDMSVVTCCPKCGFDLDLPPSEDTQVELLGANRKIEDLQVQVRLLNQKASAAIDRWADYEDELAKLRSVLDTSRKQEQEQQQQQQQTQQQTAAASPSRSSFLSAGAASRISALLSPRKSATILPSNYPGASPQAGGTYAAPSRPPSGSATAAGLPSPTPSSDELLSALSREQSLRRAAEGRLSDTSREVEELSTQLFEQANEMVASERRARAALEERVETLERRDADKRRRLDRLESAVGRIQKARALLSRDVPAGEGSSGGGGPWAG